MDFYGILFDMKNGSKMPYSKNYFDTLFAAKLEELGVKTITGTLPLTFTAKAGNAVDWEIEGNDDVGENLFDGRFKEGYYNTASGTFFPGAGRYIATEKIEIESAQTYTVSFECDKEGSTTGNKADSFVYFWNESTYLGYEQALTKELQTFTTPSNATLCAFIVGAGGSNIMDLEDVSDAMLVKGSTAPDHYIPYQQGVGEKTVNLFDKTTVAQYRMIDRSTGEVVSSYSSRCATDWIDIKQSDTISISNASLESGAFYDSSKQYISGIYSYGANKSVPSGAQYVRLTVLFDDLDYFMLVEGSTAPTTYIPYGYQIPLTVSQQGQPDKNYDIYIGDTPLTEGESVSKTSTGVDIELFEGENTISTTLYNKPVMEIKYK